VASFFLLPEGLVPDGDGSSSDSRQILMPPARPEIIITTAVLGRCWQKWSAVVACVRLGRRTIVSCLRSSAKRIAATAD